MVGDPVAAPPIIAIGGENVPQPFRIRDPHSIRSTSGPTVSKEIAIMGVPLATSWGGLLIGLYGYFGGRLSGRSVPASILHALAVGLIGGFLILFKSLLH